MYRANSQAATSTSWTTSGSYVTSSTESTYSGQGQAVTATTTYAINGAQQRNQQPQVALANFRPPYGQNFPGRVSQFFSGGALPASWPLPLPASWPLPLPASWPLPLPASWPLPLPASWPLPLPASWPLPLPASWPLPSPARWPSASSAYLPGLQGMPVAGLKEVQGGQTQQIIPNAQALQSRGHYSNQIAAGALSSKPNPQQISSFGPSQTASFHAGDQISTHQLQQDVNDPNKWQFVATASNPATVCTPNQHFHVTKSGTPTPAIAATAKSATSTKSQSSNSELNAPWKMQRHSKSKKKLHICNTPGCAKVFTNRVNLKAHIQRHTGEKHFVCSCGKGFFRFYHLKRHRRKHAAQQLQQDPYDPNKRKVVATAKNPGTLNTPNQQSRVTESCTPDLATVATLTTATWIKSESENSENTVPLEIQRIYCTGSNSEKCPNPPYERNSESKKKLHKCKIPGCTKVYTSKVNLKTHIRRHTGDKRFVCSCGNGFFRSYDLKKHRKLHTGEKTFPVY